MKTFICILLLIGCVASISVDNMRSLRRKSFTFAKKAVVEADLKGLKFEAYAPLLAGASGKDVAAIDGTHAKTPKENMIIIDAGGSGTRLYIYQKGINNALVLKSNIKATDTAQTDTLKAWIKQARGINKGKTIALATAGMRLGGKSGAMQAIACDGESDKSKCLGRVMPGALEGAFGFIDGSYSVGGKLATSDTGCYIEFGSTSSQLAFKSNGKIWALSGVRSGLNPVDNSLVNVAKCDAKGKASSQEFVTECETAITSSPVFDDKLKECLEKGQKVLANAKCDKLLLRLNAGVNDRIRAGMLTMPECMDTTGSPFRTEFNCGAALGMKNIVKGLGLKDLLSNKSMVSLVGNEEVEWAWGLYKYFSSQSSVDISKFAGVDQGASSDCGLIDIPATY
jgi:hypothetical protein